jgi:hypothetical protein
METKQAIKFKAAMEENIGIMISAFERETGLYVDDIDIARSTVDGIGRSTAAVILVKATVKL